jgi:hypothetical protein
MAVSLMKPPNGGFRSETAKNLTEIYGGFTYENAERLYI